MAGHLIATIILLSALVAGCAKQPATMAASAPAPVIGGDAKATPAPVQSPGDSSTAGAKPPTGGTATPSAGGRPAPKDFTAVSDLPDVYFDFDRYEIRPSAQRTLLAHATWLRSQTKALMIIEGHCDERGTNEYNIALGERRAKAAMNYLVSRGVDARRLTVISYGEQRPQCRDRNEVCWAKNRRAHFLVKAE
jgi:peptidoglycan-associated lipoprotein